MRRVKSKSYGRGTCYMCSERKPLSRFGRIENHSRPGAPRGASGCAGGGSMPKADKA